MALVKGCDDVLDPPRPPLSALLSQLLVAFTIEADNEFERRVPHRTTNMPPAERVRGAPWLVSLVMWFNCMRYVGADGVTVAELERLARTRTNLAGMLRWRYIDVVPASGARSAGRPADRFGPVTVVRATSAGLAAGEVWRLLPELVEQRWRDRFGADEVSRLRELLSVVVGQLDPEMPDCLPILGYGLFSRTQRPQMPEMTDSDPPQMGSAAPVGPSGSVNAAPSELSGLPLYSLLSRALMAFALAFESRAKLSLAISANVLRVLDDVGVRVRDLPVRSGVSKESISMAMGILTKRNLAVIDAGQSGSRWRTARLTPEGVRAQAASQRLIAGIETRWQDRFGSATIQNLRDTTTRLAGTAVIGLTPDPTSWRASVRRPETLPHFPMILHRGGWPDGA